MSQGGTEIQQNPARDLVDLRAGRITIEELAEKWGSARYVEPDESPTPETAAGIWDRAENRDRDTPGSWQEIRNFYLSGDLSQEEYRMISERADFHAGASAQQAPPDGSVQKSADEGDVTDAAETPPEGDQPPAETPPTDKPEGDQPPADDKPTPEPPKPEEKP